MRVKVAKLLKRSRELYRQNTHKLDDSLFFLVGVAEKGGTREEWGRALKNVGEITDKLIESFLIYVEVLLLKTKAVLLER